MPFDQKDKCTNTHTTQHNTTHTHAMSLSTLTEESSLSEINKVLKECANGETLTNPNKSDYSMIQTLLCRLHEHVCANYDQREAALPLGRESLVTVLWAMIHEQRLGPWNFTRKEVLHCTKAVFSGVMGDKQSTGASTSTCMLLNWALKCIHFLGPLFVEHLKRITASSSSNKEHRIEEERMLMLKGVIDSHYCGVDVNIDASEDEKQEQKKLNNAKLPEDGKPPLGEIEHFLQKLIDGSPEAEEENSETTIAVFLLWVNVSCVQTMCYYEEFYGKYKFKPLPLPPAPSVGTTNLAIVEFFDSLLGMELCGDMKRQAFTLFLRLGFQPGSRVFLSKKPGINNEYVSNPSKYVLFQYGPRNAKYLRKMDIQKSQQKIISDRKLPQSMQLHSVLCQQDDYQLLLAWHWVLWNNTFKSQCGIDFIKQCLVFEYELPDKVASIACKKKGIRFKWPVILQSNHGFHIIDHKDSMSSFSDIYQCLSAWCRMVVSQPYNGISPSGYNVTTFLSQFF